MAFTLNNLIRSSCASKKGINNNLPQTGIIRDNAHKLLSMLNTLMDEYAKSHKSLANNMKITSGYRCEALNKAVCGRKKSNHKNGLSADITYRYENSKIANNTIFKNFVHQLGSQKKYYIGEVIDEYNTRWIHIDYSSTNKFKRTTINTKVKDTQALEGNIRNGTCVPNCERTSGNSENINGLRTITHKRHSSKAFIPNENVKYKKSNLYILVKKEPNRTGQVENGTKLYVYTKDHNTLIAQYAACAGKNLGQKTKSGDMKTPEGTFKIDYIIDSSTKTYPGEGLVYGKWFLHLNATMSENNKKVDAGIAIHGSGKLGNTIPGRESHGCIRLLDEDIIHLNENFAYEGMTVKITADPK